MAGAESGTGLGGQPDNGSCPNVRGATDLVSLQSILILLVEGQLSAFGDDREANRDDLAVGGPFVFGHVHAVQKDLGLDGDVIAR